MNCRQLHISQPDVLTVIVCAQRLRAAYTVLRHGAFLNDEYVCVLVCVCL